MPRTLQGLTHMDCKNAGWGGSTYLMLASQWRSDHFNLEKSNKSKSQISEFLLLWFWCVHCGAANQPSSVDDYSHSVHEEEGAQGTELWGWSYFYFAWVNNTRNKKPRRQNSGTVGNQPGWTCSFHFQGKIQWTFQNPWSMTSMCAILSHLPSPNTHNAWVSGHYYRSHHFTDAETETLMGSASPALGAPSPVFPWLVKAALCIHRSKFQVPGEALNRTRVLKGTFVLRKSFALRKILSK